MTLHSRITARQIGLASIGAAALFVGQSMIRLFTNLGVGEDFLPLRHAGHNLVSGHSVYADPTFVYPPTAAPLFVPFAAGSAMGSYVIWLGLSVLALIGAAGLIARVAPGGIRLPVFTVGVLALVCGAASSFSLFLGNLSVLLVPVAVLILLAFHRERWLLGCALLAATLLVKPLLAPLLLVPAVRRRWRELGLTMLPATGLLGLAMLFVPGGRDFVHVLSYCLSGTNLHGQNSINNLSLRGWAEFHHEPASWGTVASVVLVVAVAARLIGCAFRSGVRAISPLWLGNLALLTTLLAGQISEIHFLLTVIAGLLLQLTLERSRFNLFLALPGLVMVALPLQYLDLVVPPNSIRQGWLIGAELCLWLALILSRRPVSRRASDDWLVVAEPELAFA